MAQQPGNIGRLAPPRSVEAAYAAKLKSMQQDIDQLKTARSIGNTVLDGRVGGTLTVLDPNGKLSGNVGTLFNGESGIEFFRQSGSACLLVYKDFISILDQSGNIIFSDDTVRGKGIASPWLPLANPANSNVATWPATTNTTYTTVASSYFVRQNPGLYFSFYCYADAGTTGRCRLTIDGVTIATTDVFGNTFYVWTGTYYFPSSWSYLSTAYLTVDAQRVSGSGSVRTQNLLLTGVQS